MLERVLAQRPGKMFPRAAGILAAKHAVVVHRHHCAIARRADGVQVHLVTKRRLVSFVELGTVRERHHATAITVRRFHAVAQVVGRAPCFAAIRATQHDPIGHLRMRPARTFSPMAGNAAVHHDERVARNRRHRPAVMIAVTRWVHRQMHGRHLQHARLGRPFPNSLLRGIHAEELGGQIGGCGRSRRYG